VDADRLLMTPAYRREGPLYLTNLQDSSIEEIQVLDSLGHPLHFGPLIWWRSSLVFLLRSRHRKISVFSRSICARFKTVGRSDAPQLNLALTNFKSARIAP